MTATIQKIKSIEPVYGYDKNGNQITADSIVLVKFEDVAWQCVAAKDQDFDPGELVIYVEIDSILPEREWSEFMRSRKFHVKTAKFLKTTLSQGLVFPLSILEDPFAYEFRQGDEVGLMLGITHYEKPVPQGGDAKGNFPHFIPKTDVLRLQSFPLVLREITGLRMYRTLKCDGTSVTFFNHDGQFGVCSRNLELLPGDNLYWKIAKKYNLEDAVLQEHALQGEICGPNIQGNPMGLEEPTLFLFDIYDITTHTYWDFDYVADFAYTKGIPVVKYQLFAETGPMGDKSLQWHVDQLVGDALLCHYEPAGWRIGKPVLPGEGYVYRPKHETFSPALGGRLMFKVINNDYKD